MNVDQRILHQRHTPQGNLTSLPTEAANVPIETGPEGCHPPLAPGLPRGQEVVNNAIYVSWKSNQSRPTDD